MGQWTIHKIILLDSRDSMTMSMVSYFLIVCNGYMKNLHTQSLSSLLFPQGHKMEGTKWSSAFLLNRLQLLYRHIPRFPVYLNEVYICLPHLFLDRCTVNISLVIANQIDPTLLAYKSVLDSFTTSSAGTSTSRYTRIS